jgi:hypothetical protein
MEIHELGIITLYWKNETPYSMVRRNDTETEPMTTGSRKYSPVSRVSRATEAMAHHGWNGPVE